jgi:O-acetyl-ADP-ribose deacetylase (regulator of RNase III)
MPEFLNGRIEISEGDITELAVDAIVNAANRSLLGGGGVGGCETGQAKIAGGYRLPAGHVILTVGPVWHGGKNQEEELLADCYRNSLALAVQHDLKTVAFPSISTGVYGFPIDLAAPIAIRTVKYFLIDNPSIIKVIFCAFGQRDFQTYLNHAGELLK